jgi:hypothetical protein
VDGEARIDATIPWMLVLVADACAGTDAQGSARWNTA